MSIAGCPGAENISIHEKMYEQETAALQRCPKAETLPCTRQPFHADTSFILIVNQ